MSGNQSQAYQLKSIRYQKTLTKILLQNENGPCPLLAAANALLLRGVITLDPACVRNGVASTDDVVNMLANRALTAAGGNNGNDGNNDDDDANRQMEMASGNNNNSSHHEYHLNEVLSLLPNLQHGMDVNPKFTSGPTGVEYTNNLAAFDLLGVELVHGWLLDPQDAETTSVVESKTYNELIETVIEGNEARDAVVKVEKELLEKQQTLLDKENDDALECEAAMEGVDDNDVVEAGDDSGEVGVVTDAQKISENDVIPATENSPEVEGGNDDETCQQSENADIPEKETTVPENDEVPSGEEKKGGDNESKGGPTVAGDTEGAGSECDNSTEQCNGGSSAGGESSPVEPDRLDQADNNATNNTAPPEETSTEELKAEEVVVDQIALQKEIHEMREKMSHLSLQISRSEVANAFLTSSGHQLTYHGLHQLHDHMGDDVLCVFFRNNHFATLTKHDGVLYLLVTDLGYANTPEIVWEKLDNIDGNTEYANEFFARPKPRAELKPAAGPTIAPELLLAQRSQAESDYQLALAMSKGGTTATTSQGMDDDEGKLIEAAKELSLKTYNGDNDDGDASNTSNSQLDSDMEVAMAYQRAQQQSEHESEQLARQLQDLEYSRQQRPAANARRPVRAPAAPSAAAASSCTIS